MCVLCLFVRGWGEDWGSFFDVWFLVRYISLRYCFCGFLIFWRMNCGFLMDFFDVFNEKNLLVKNYFFVLILNLFFYFSDFFFFDICVNSWNIIEIEGFLINCCKINIFYILDFKSVGWKLLFFCYYLFFYEENFFIKI